MIRKLTKRWYIKRKLFGFTIMVETIQTRIDFFGDVSPEHIIWERATAVDLLELNINII